MEVIGQSDVQPSRNLPDIPSVSKGKWHTSHYSFSLFFQAISFFTLPAILPDNALGSELAISARISACLTVVQAFPAVTYFHFLAGDTDPTIRMVSALHN